MAPRTTCSHERARFHSVQRLGEQCVELWHCPECHSTVAAENTARRPRPVAAA
jgi:uncharacterized protein YlaI